MLGRVPAALSTLEPLPSCRAAGHQMAPSSEIVGRDRQFPFDDVFEVTRCMTCGVATTTPRLGAADLDRFYPGNYAPYAAVPEASGSLRARMGGSVDALRA